MKRVHRCINSADMQTKKSFEDVKSEARRLSASLSRFVRDLKSVDNYTDYAIDSDFEILARAAETLEDISLGVIISE